MQNVAIVEPRSSSDSSHDEEADGASTPDPQPSHCVLLRAGGQMGMLDMAQGLYFCSCHAVYRSDHCCVSGSCWHAAPAQTRVFLIWLKIHAAVCALPCCSLLRFRLTAVFQASDSMLSCSHSGRCKIACVLAFCWLYSETTYPTCCILKTHENRFQSVESYHFCSVHSWKKRKLKMLQAWFCSRAIKHK